MEEVASKTVEYILTTEDEIKVDQNMRQEEFKRLKDDFYKVKIKKQLVKLMNHVE